MSRMARNGPKSRKGILESGDSRDYGMEHLSPVSDSVWMQQKLLEV